MNQGRHTQCGTWDNLSVVSPRRWRTSTFPTGPKVSTRSRNTTWALQVFQGEVKSIAHDRSRLFHTKNQINVSLCPFEIYQALKPTEPGDYKLQLAGVLLSNTEGFILAPPGLLYSHFSLYVWFFIVTMAYSLDSLYIYRHISIMFRFIFISMYFVIQILHFLSIALVLCWSWYSRSLFLIQNKDNL